MWFFTISKYFGIVIVFLSANALSAQEMVTTKSGVVKGMKINECGTDVYAYLGIPYATSPIGEIRFKDTMPVKSWKGIYNATKLPSSCMQEPAIPPWESQPTDRENFDEDCLYLNIWVPINEQQSDKKAVMVWIYGAAFNSGSSNLEIYDGKVLATQGDVIVVSFNYRLGAFGFLYSGTDDAPGNMGLKDQVLALRWIKDNIETFGGDPSHITIFGECTGSVSASMHLISPLTKGLFTHAILQSGTAYQPTIVSEPAAGILMSNRLASLLGCLEGNVNITTHPSEVIACMRNRNASDIAAIERNNFVGETAVSFLPLQGGNYLPKHPIEEFKAGNIQNMSILIGNVKDEGSFGLGFIDQNLFKEDWPVVAKEQGAKYIQAVFQQVSNPPINVITDIYLKSVSPDDSRLMLKRTYDSIGDWLLYCPSIFLSDSFATHGMKAYYYVFSHRRREISSKQWIGVPHFEEVPFVFGRHLTLNNTCAPKDLEFSNRIIGIWASFAKTGKPVDPALGFEWPEYSEKKPAAVVLNPENVEVVNPYKEECKFWKEYY